MAQAVCERVRDGQDLSFDEMAEVLDAIMRGLWSEEDTVALLAGLSEKGETVEELAGAAAALRRHMTPIRSRRADLVDTCGTGGDASGTFNISTAAALVAAAAGVPVAKHGNRGITSRSGSADVLSELGVNVEAPAPIVERCLAEVGLAFCFAPLLHPSMRHVAAARKKIGKPTIFNLLGPLCNPASAPFQLLGVGKRPLQEKLAAALCLLNTRRALVVTGEDGLDEVTLSDTTHVIEVSGRQARRWEWHPEDFGIPRAGKESLVIDSPAASARLIRSILDGASGPPRDIVVLNAAAAIWVASPEDALPTCTARAVNALESGQARAVLDRLVAVSHAG